MIKAPEPGEYWVDAARRQGGEARLEGKPFVSCPYPAHGTLNHLWKEGWTNEDNALRCPKYTEPAKSGNT